MTGGHGWWMGIQADGADAVRRAARENLRAGAGSIKLMATGGMMTGGRQAGQPQLTVEEMAAAVDEAHKRGVPVAAHAESRIGVLNAMRGRRRLGRARPRRRRTGDRADARARRRARPDDPVGPPDHRPRRRRPASRTSSSSSATPCTRAWSSSWSAPSQAGVTIAAGQRRRRPAGPDRRHGRRARAVRAGTG